MERLEIEILAKIDGLEKNLNSAQTQLQNFDKTTEQVGTTSNKAFTLMQQGSLKSAEALKLQRAQLQGLADLELKNNKLVAFNQQIEQLTLDINKLGNAGKTGFDELGNAIEVTEVKASKFQAAIARATSLDALGGRAVTQITRQIVGLGVGFLSFAVGAKALEVLGNALVEAYNKLQLFTDKTTEAAEAQKDMQAALAGTEYSKAVSSVYELTENIRLAKEGFISKKEVLKEYNDTIGKTVGHADDLNQAENLLIEHGQAYIQMTLLKASAQLALADAAKASYEAEQKRQKPTSDFSNIVTFGAGQPGLGRVPGVEDALTLAKRRTDAEQAYKDRSIKTSQDEADQKLNIFKSFEQQAAKIALDNKFDFFGGQEDPKKTVDPLVKIANKIKEVYDDLAKSLLKNSVQFNPKTGLEGAFADSFAFTEASIKSYQKAIDDLIALGYKPQSKAIQDLIDKQTKLNSLAIDPKELRHGFVIQPTPNSIALPEVKDVTLTGFNKITTKVKKDFQDLSQVILQSGVNDAFAKLGESIGSSLANGADLMQTLGGALLSVIGNIATQLGKAAIGIGIAMIGIKDAFSNPFTAIAAGVALIALGAFISSKVANITKGDTGSTTGGQLTPIRQFATGGIISGPTIGLMGEYAGARSNPEVVAPLNKLKGMLAGTQTNDLLIPEFRLRGEDIFVAMKRVTKRLGGS